MAKFAEQSRSYAVLYISYDGLLDPLGQSQIIPYLKGLSKKGIKYIVLSFEKKVNLSRGDDIRLLEREFASFGIIWKRLRYHKRLSALATFFDILYGFLVSSRLITTYRIKIVHARSYVAGLMAIILRRIYRMQLIFDMRGFWVDERIEGNIWKSGSCLYRILKYLERIFFLNSDEIISLTRAGKEEIEAFPYLNNCKTNITVIPTCVDLERFRMNGEADTKVVNPENKFVLIYTGSISTWFLPEEMLNFFKVVKRDIQKAYFLVLTQEKDVFEDILKSRKLDHSFVSVLSANYESVAKYLLLGKVGLAFYKPGYSRKGCCPTKVGEYLASGLPVIINAGIGDTDEIIKRERVGIVIEEFSESEYERVSYQLKRILLKEDNLRQRCRSVAEKYFSLNGGVEKYWQVYQKLLKV